MKKILYIVTQSDFGGTQVYVYNLATNLKGTYEIIVAGGAQGEKGELGKRLKDNNIKFINLRYLKRAINPFYDFLALFEIIKLIKKEKPDIIHLNSSKVSILGSIASFLSRLIVNCKKLIVIYTVHGWVFNEPMPAWKKLFYKYAEKFTAIFKDKIICVSEYDKQVAIKTQICNPNKLTTIHNALKTLNFLTKNEAIKKLIPNSEFRIPNSELIGTIANLYKTKGLEYLIKAIKLCVPRYALHVIIMGEGHERPFLEKLIKKYKLENNVHLVGNIKNASALLKAFDIYVCSSVKEGFPFSILEAMQAELPIISTKVGGIPEMIINNESGLLAESKNPKVLAENIKKLIDNKELKNKLSKNAKNKVIKDFNLDNFINKTKKIYNS